MHNFSMLLTQKCLSMGLIDKSYSEWLSYSIEKRATTLLTWFVLCLVGFFGFGWKLTLALKMPEKNLELRLPEQRRTSASDRLLLQVLFCKPHQMDL